MRKYIRFFTAALQKHLTYRARVFIYFVIDTGSFLVFPFIWLAIYGDRTMVGDYSKADMVTYYIVITFAALASSSHAAAYMRRDIRMGKLNTDLVQPINWLLRHFFSGYSYNVLTVGFAIPCILLLTYLFPTYIVLPQTITTLGLFILALLLAYIISCLLQSIVGMSTFWLGETGGANQIHEILEKICGGQFAPLALYPLALQKIAALLPFQYLFFFPAQIYLDKIHGITLLGHFLGMIGWILFLSFITAVMWHRGVKRFDGVGI